MTGVTDQPTSNLEPRQSKQALRNAHIYDQPTSNLEPRQSLIFQAHGVEAARPNGLWPLGGAGENDAPYVGGRLSGLKACRKGMAAPPDFSVRGGWLRGMLMFTPGATFQMLTAPNGQNRRPAGLGFAAALPVENSYAVGRRGRDDRAYSDIRVWLTEQPIIIIIFNLCIIGQNIFS